MRSCSLANSSSSAVKTAVKYFLACPRVADASPRASTAIIGGSSFFFSVNKWKEDVGKPKREEQLQMKVNKPITSSIEESKSGGAEESLATDHRA
jgi:hypothetical protein